MLFKRSDTSKNSTTTSPSAGSTGSTGCASASSGCASVSTSDASCASSEHCHQKAKGKKQQSKTSKDKSCNSSALAKDRLSALIKNDLQDEREPESVAERLKAVLKDSPRARAEQEAKLMEPSVQSDGAGADTEACAGASDSDEPKFYAPVVVYTVEELAQAQKDRAERIVVKGELAEKLKVALKGLRSIGAGSLNTLALCLSGAALLAPFTGGVSLGAAGTAMGTLGAALTATAIAAISAIGLALVIAVFKGYDEVKLGGGGVELVIKKHKDKK
ncbi:hypothetical protein MXE38_02135 [Anaerobiospirillum sp. NML120448]|uniref:hypothetical protein n=1 Tax=Anaerobiospirillum sp. NML120448 TaxID=2932816 RepID=UPI001FF65A9D|nr:hypothetical protein [Anaerobiospirillum sp. NML120448]MCK0513675.1 hypothetical protein [Anaerobiospirillum sp. NML120448]